MAHRRSRALAILVAVAAVCAGTADAGPQAERVRVNATVSFERDDGVFTNIRLAIKRNATTWRSGPLGLSYFSRPRVFVRDLDADGELDVRLDTYTGGAHCCFRTRFFRWLPARMSYARTFRNWGDAGYRAKNLDGRGPVELLSSDARFGYMFTAFAGSLFPIQIWDFDTGRLRDVTRLFPGQVELDAKGLWRTYLEHRRTDDVRGVLAAWVADQFLLGRGDEGWATLRRLGVRGVFGPRPDLAGWPQGGAYLRELRAFLVKLGYA
jgi:hypothetical protein